jgi:hypothetical protein
MDLFRYIKLLQGYKYLGSNIGNSTTSTLSEFSYVQHLSAYDLYSKFKNSRPSPLTLDALDSKISYKNTRKHVKRLESLEFIVPVKVKDTLHGKKYYRISDVGLFQLFLRSNLSLSFVLPWIVELHEDYSIFEVLLYPIFEKETLPALKEFLKSYKNLVLVGEDVSHHIIWAIERYIRECCSRIFEFIQYLPYIHKYTPQYMKRGFDYYGAALEGVNTQLTLLRNELVTKIILYFQRYKDTKGKNAVVTLAQDDKFMNTADDIQIGFKKGIDIAMHLRTRS